MSVSTSRGSDPREHAHRRALGEVEQLVHEELDLVRGDLRAALVDLVCSPVVGSITAVFVRDSSRMRTKSLSTDSCVSWSTMRVPVAPPVQPGRDHGLRRAP
jgi:hypothetical protein